MALKLTTVIGNEWITRAINSFNVSSIFVIEILTRDENKKRWCIRFTWILNYASILQEYFCQRKWDVHVTLNFRQWDYGNRARLILEVALIGAGLVWTAGRQRKPLRRQWFTASSLFYLYLATCRGMRLVPIAPPNPCLHRERWSEIRESDKSRLFDYKTKQHIYQTHIGYINRDI